MAKTDEERGAFGAWAYNTRDSLHLSVEQVIDRLPTKWSAATLRKAEAGPNPPGRGMIRELWQFYRAEGVRQGVTVPPPPSLTPKGAMAEDRDELVSAIREQTAALNRLVGLLAPLAARGLGLGAAEAEAIARAAGVPLDTPRRPRP